MSLPTWITLHPTWYAQELDLLRRHYPLMKVDQGQLQKGRLCLYGEIVVRPAGKAKRYTVELQYPAATPFEHPLVTPLEGPVTWNGDTVSTRPQPRFFDGRHQMPGGNLCLFQREPRIDPAGDVLTCVQVLHRAQAWFLGLDTGVWPPDTVQSELEAHFDTAAAVLVPGSFYAPDIAGHGTFYFVSDHRRLIDANQTGLCAMLLTGMSHGNTIIQMVDGRSELCRIYPWVDAVAWDPAKLETLKPEDIPNYMRRGFWWQLPREPVPFRNGAGFLDVLRAAVADPWAEIWQRTNELKAASPWLFLGMLYPSRAGGHEWLFVCLHIPEGKGPGGVPLVRQEAELRTLFKRARIYCFRSYRMAQSDLQLRNHGVVANAVYQKTVAFIGLGALGSEVAELLAKAGVGHFKLCDLDCLSTGNVARHVGGITDFGASKTRVVFSRLLAINPHLQFEEDDVVVGSATGNLDRLRKFLSSADLVVCTTADEGVEAVINQEAVMAGKTVLYGRALKQGNVGRIFLVRPGQDACKACLAGFHEDGQQGKTTPPDWIAIPDTEGPVYHECGRPVIAASAVDLSFVSGVIGRVALDVLENKAPDHNHWIWSSIPAANIDPRLASRMSTFAGTLQPHASCSVCQSPAVSQVVLSQELRSQIVSMAESWPGVETGGVLIGHVDEARRAIVTCFTDAGPNAERSATGFRKDVPFTQAELDKASKELGAKGTYIGEWHSHLDPDPEPSARDIESLAGIAQSPDYETRCPLLLLVGIDPTTRAAIRTRSWVFPADGRAREVNH